MQMRSRTVERARQICARARYEENRYGSACGLRHMSAMLPSSHNACPRHAKHGFVGLFRRRDAVLPQLAAAVVVT